MNTIIEKIRAEVERQREEIRPTDTGEMKVVGTPTQLEQGWLNALSWMEKVLDTLQEQPVDLEKEIKKEKLKWRFFDEIGFASAYDYRQFDGRDIDRIARHFYELGRQSKEQPLCENFDLESDRFFRKLPLRANTPPIPDEYIDEETFDRIARHFAQWGAEHLKK